jgi:dUTP pyrophosphatase
MKVKLKKTHKDAVIPKQATELAGGWDVTCTEIIQETSDFVICKLGFALQPPPNYKVTLVPRSSLTKTNWIVQNSPGLGDADYLGEYQYRFRCIPHEIYYSKISESDKLGYSEFPFKVGDRIGQIYLEEVIPIEFEEVDELSDTERGTGGFGSTNN